MRDHLRNIKEGAIAQMGAAFVTAAQEDFGHGTETAVTAMAVDHSARNIAAHRFGEFLG